MKRRRIIVITALLVPVLGFLVWVDLTPRDPLYDGKPLTQWVDEYSAESLTNRFIGFESQMGSSRPRRIREFGPSAVPALIRLVETKHPSKQKLYNFLKTHELRNRWATDFVKKWPVESLRPRTAAIFLGYLGSDAEPAIPALMRAAVDTNTVLASTAIGVLGSIHRQPDLVVPLLIKLAGDTNRSLAASAIVAVRWYTERPDLVVPVLIQVITNQNFTKAPTDFGAVYAAQGLPGFGSNALAAIPALRQMTFSSPVHTAIYAAEALQKIDPDSTVDATVPIYVLILLDRNYPSPFSAILGLYGLGARARSAGLFLEDVATSKSRPNQEAAYALKAVNPEAAARIWPSLLRAQLLLTNNSNQTQPETREQLAARVQPMKDQAVPYLVGLLKDTNTSYAAIVERQHAAWLLGEMGSAAQAAVPALTAAASNSQSASVALMKIRGESLLPLIEKLRTTQDQRDWAELAVMVADFGTNAEPAVPILISAMKDPGRSYIELNSVAFVLGEIHRRSDLSLPALRPLLGHPAMPIRKTTLEALAKFGSDAKPAVPKILESLEDLDYSARVAATNALKQIDPEAARKMGIGTKQRRIILATLLIVILGGFAWFILRVPPDPVYEGKRLSGWLEQYYLAEEEPRRLADPKPAASREAEDAIRQIGTNGIPTLLGLAASAPYPFGHGVIKVLRQILSIQSEPPINKHALARIGFNILGPAARPAVPALLEMLKQGNYYAQLSATDALGSIGPDAEAAIPILIQRARQTNNMVQWSATAALGNIHQQPELVVPVLIGNLSVSNSLLGLHDTAYYALEALGKFGPQARSAVPAIIPFLNVPDPQTRAQATNVLAKIDPEAAAKAGIK